jgi:regulator of sigma E protease
MSIPEPIVTAVAFVVALGVLVFVHELGHFLTAKRLDVKVLRFSIGFGPVLWRRQRGESEYALSAIPLGGYVKMLGEDSDGDEPVAPEEQHRAFSAQGPLRRAAIIFAGPATNFVFAFAVYALVFGSVGAPVPSPEPRLGGVSASTPADRAGLHSGDLVVSIDGVAMGSWDNLSKTVRGSGGKSLHMVLDRDGQRVELDVTPEEHDLPSLDGGQTERAFLIGVEPSRDWEDVGIAKGFLLAAEQTGGTALAVLQGLGQMVTGHVSVKELGGPIAIAQAAGRQARNGLWNYLMMLALLSINLGVLNLMPVPALDGGHLALLSVEGVLGRPLKPRALELAQQVGVLLLVSLMVFVFYNDIHRLVQG